MARILCVNDFIQYAEMMGLFLEEQGHDVCSESVPLDMRAVTAFCPDVIVVGIVRKPEHVKEALTDFYVQVDGAKALRDLATHPETASCPLVIAAVGVQEHELPKDVPFVAFVEVPNKFDQLPGMIERIVAAKGHRIIPE